jgi:hypothetical protein
VRSSRALCAAVLLLAAGCTSSGGGKHSTAASSGSVTSGSVSSGGTGSASNQVTPPATSRPAPSGSAARKRASTAIGDPVTADLCAAVGLDSLRGIGSGLTPTFDKRQDPPGCAVTLSDGARAVLGLSVFGDPGTPKAAAGRTSRTESGQTVYVYPYDAGTGRCEREIAATGVLLVIDSNVASGSKPDRATACAGTDAMTARLAEAVDADDVPRLQLADPTVSDLDACAVARRADITSLSAFAGATVHSLSFGVGCQLRPRGAFLFVNFVISSVRTPGGATSTTVGTHSVYGVATTGSFCSYVSPQGRTSDGQYEQVAMSATATGARAQAGGLCAETKAALGRYLDAAGLR